MFRPLAYSKSFAMTVAAVLVVTLDPALRLLLHACQAVLLPPALALQAGQWLAGRQDPSRREASLQPLLDADL